MVDQLKNEFMRIIGLEPIPRMDVILSHKRIPLSPNAHLQSLGSIATGVATSFLLRYPLFFSPIEKMIESPKKKEKGVYLSSSKNDGKTAILCTLELVFLGSISQFSICRIARGH